MNKMNNYMAKDVMILTGAGQIGMAIARRMGHGMKIVGLVTHPLH